ncbi:MAG: FKBP-type peptidyl-prolyl cis-trans isomerase [Candidatus Cyclobacteriaceae bacterium M3_2C_046]
MTEARKGNTVKVHYTGRLNDGTVFDSSVNKEPLSFKLGEGNMIPGFEKAVEGLKEGEKVTANIDSQEAYGERRDDLLVEVPRQNVPESITPEVGQQLSIKQPDGNTIPVVVTETKPESIVLDANHPLAGKDLIFDIEVVQVS